MAGLTDKRRWQIRNTFLQKRESYGRKDAARRTGIPLGELTRDRYSWPDLVELAMLRCGWTLAEIHEALGEDDDLPRLLQLQRITVRIPAYQVVMLHRLADGASLTLDEWLSRHMRTVAEAHQDASQAWQAAKRFPR